MVATSPGAGTDRMETSIATHIDATDASIANRWHSTTHPYQHGPTPGSCVLSDGQASVVPAQQQRDRRPPRMFADTLTARVAVNIGRLRW